MRRSFSIKVAVLVAAAVIVIAAVPELAIQSELLRLRKVLNIPTSQVALPPNATRALWSHAGGVGPVRMRRLSVWHFVWNAASRSVLKHPDGADIRLGTLAAKQILVGSSTSRGPRFAMDELAVAIWISRSWTPAETLTFVATGLPGPGGAVGLDRNAEWIFRHPLSDLSPEELAVLIAVAEGPAHFDPVCSRENATQKRNQILEEFAMSGFITQAEAAAAEKSAIETSSEYAEDARRRCPEPAH